MKKEQRGFSLVEVMVVMIIVVALSAGGLYGSQKWQQQQRLWITLQQVRNLLEQLRSDANWKNRDHQLSLGRSGSGWCLASLAQGHDCISPSRWQLAQPFPDVDIVAMTDGLGFYGLRSTAWPGHLILRSPAGEWRIVVSAWGRIRTCKVSEAGTCG